MESYFIFQISLNRLTSSGQENPDLIRSAESDDSGSNATRLNVGDGRRDNIVIDVGADVDVDADVESDRQKNVVQVKITFNGNPAENLASLFRGFKPGPQVMG